ncbi:MAG: threonylcarbamoyl-AMP synthase [Bacteroidales bacterium]|jgi:L-threonylcarbamoyladenylate synthase|nr:threonylcarbamoyl-AMP synthase [Bacteroidales bacterium]
MEEDVKDFVSECAKVLKKGGTILYPTDTVWGIGCDATNQKAVDKIFKIKGRNQQKSFIILLDDPEKIAQYADDVSPIAYDFIKKYTRPLTIIYPNAKKLAKNVIASNGSIAIRVVREHFCEELIKTFGKPIVSTSANFSGYPAPATFSDIDSTIKEMVDYVVPFHQDSLNKINPSTIIQLFPNGTFRIIRD